MFEGEFKAEMTVEESVKTVYSSPKVTIYTGYSQDKKAVKEDMRRIGSDFSKAMEKAKREFAL